MVLNYTQVSKNKHNSSSYSLNYNFLQKYTLNIQENISSISIDDYNLRSGIHNYSMVNIFKSNSNRISEKEIINKLKNKCSDEKDFIENKREEFENLWKYGYRLYYVADVEEETYNEIAQFIKSGILI